METSDPTRGLPELLTIGEVSAASRLSAKTLRNRAYRGAPPLPIRVAGRLRWRRADLLRWLGDLHPIIDWAGKLAGAVARIVGLLYLGDYCADPDPLEREVSADTFERVIAIGRYVLALCGSRSKRWRPANDPRSLPRIARLPRRSPADTPRLPARAIVGAVRGAAMTPPVAGPRTETGEAAARAAMAGVNTQTRDVLAPPT